MASTQPARLCELGALQRWQHHRMTHAGVSPSETTQTKMWLINPCLAEEEATGSTAQLPGEAFQSSATTRLFRKMFPQITEEVFPQIPSPYMGIDAPLGRGGTEQGLCSAEEEKGCYSLERRRRLGMD